MLRCDPFRYRARMPAQRPGAAAGPRRAPRFMPMDLYRSGDHYVLHADLPGIDPGSVDVHVDNGTLTIRAERSSRSEQDVQWLTSERFTGTFQRQLSLGEGIDTDAISATYDNGVLSVTIPVAEKAKPRRIQVTGHSNSRQVIEAGEQKSSTA